MVTWPGYWSLIGWEWSHDLDTGLWLGSITPLQRGAHLVLPFREPAASTTAPSRNNNFFVQEKLKTLDTHRILRTEERGHLCIKGSHNPTIKLKFLRLCMGPLLCHIILSSFLSFNGKDEVCGFKFKVRTENKHCQPKPMPQIKQLDFDELR